MIPKDQRDKYCKSVQRFKQKNKCEKSIYKIKECSTIENERKRIIGVQKNRRKMNTDKKKNKRKKERKNKQ